jgi:hypothetical protein
MRIILFCISFFILSLSGAFAQNADNKKQYDKNHRKGTNYEYYKNGKLKSVSKYKRKIFYSYTTTYWTVKEYDMAGNIVRLTKKIIQTGRREDYEKVVKEEVFVYPQPTIAPTQENK